MPYKHLKEESLVSTCGTYRRKIWIQSSLSNIPDKLIVFLDGELFIEKVNACQVLKKLQKQKKYKSTMALYISGNGSDSRQVDYLCNNEYSRFIACDITRWISTTYPTISSEQLFLSGLSLSGLCASHVALLYPDNYSSIISLSPSFWWDNEKFIKLLGNSFSKSLPIWISVGDKEIKKKIYHKPKKLYQKLSQIDSCKRTVKQLLRYGYNVNFHIYKGGHDANCWNKELYQSIKWCITKSKVP